MANPKSYKGSFAEGFINAFLQARRLQMYNQYFRFRMLQGGYNPDTGEYKAPADNSIEGIAKRIGEYVRGQPTAWEQEQKAPVGGDPSIRAHIIQKSEQLGKDPNQALNIWHAESSGGKNLVGDGGSSFGDLQAHVGGINPSMPHPGVGDDFRNTTGLDPSDPKNRIALLDFSLEHAAKNGWGDWSTSKQFGYKQWQPYKVAGAMQPPPTALPTQVVHLPHKPNTPPVTERVVTPGVSQQSQTQAQPSTGEYQPTTGIARAPPTWVPENPPVNKPQQQTPVPSPTPRPQQQQPPVNPPLPPSRPTTGADSPAPVIPTPAQSMTASNQGPNMDDMIAMRDLQGNDSTPMAFQDGGEVDPNAPPVVQPDDSDPQTQAGQGQMMSAAKAEATAPEAMMQNKFNRMMRQQTQPAQATPSNPLQSAQSAMANFRQSMASNWASIFSGPNTSGGGGQPPDTSGAGGAPAQQTTNPSPAVGADQTSTGLYADGGEVDDQEMSPEQLDYQMASSGGLGPEQAGTGGTQPSAAPAIMPEQIAMAGGMRMPSMSSGLGRQPALPSPRLGMGGSGAPKPPKPGMEGTGLMPEGMNDQIPTETPQIADQQGNPSKGFTDAIVGGLRHIISSFGLNLPGGIPNQQQSSNQQAFNKGEGAMSKKDFDGISDAVDRQHLLTAGMRNVAAMEAVSKFYMLQGRPDIANETTAGMVMYLRQLSKDYGDVAVKAFHKGNLDEAVGAIQAGYNDAVPDAKSIQISKIGGDRYNLSQRNLNNQEIYNRDVGPAEIYAGAMGLHTGIGFWKQLEQVASAYDPVSKANVATDQQQQEAAREQQAVAGIGGGFRQNTPGVASGPAIPSPSAPPQSAPAPQTAPGATPPQVMPTGGQSTAQPPPAAPPQPGAPTAQPISTELPPDREAQIYGRHFDPQGNPIIGGQPYYPPNTPIPQGDKQADLEAQRAYMDGNRRYEDMRKQAASEHQAELQREGLNQREQFTAASSMEREQASEKAAREREEFAQGQLTQRQQQEDRAIKERSDADVTRAARAPMDEKEFQPAMEGFKPTDVLPNLKPEEQQSVMGAVGNGVRFNKGMNVGQVSDFVRGMVSGQYSLDPKAKPKEMSDDYGDRSIFTYVRGDGSKGKITMMHEDMDNLANMIKSRVPKPQAAGPQAPIPPAPTGRYVASRAATQTPTQRPAIPWMFRPTQAGTPVNPKTGGTAIPPR